MATTQAPTKAFDPNEFAAKIWSDHAPEYGKMVNLGMSKDMINAVLETADKDKPLGQATAVLDDGCGTGQITSGLIGRYGSQLPANVRLLATDFSDGMVQQVEKTKQTQQQSLPLWSKVETGVLDAANLHTIPDSTISHVLSNLCLFMVPQKEQAVREVHRVLQPGGLMVHSCIKSVPWVESLECIKQIRPETDLTLPLDPTWRTEGGLYDAAKDAGFTDIRVFEVPMPMEIPSEGVAFWKAFLKQTNPATRAVFHRWSDEEKDQAAVLVDETLRQKHGDGPMTLMGTGYVVSAKKP